jgi:hypothetical protein
MSAAASIAGSASRNAQLPEEAQDIEELHGVGATSLPARSCRWTQGGRGCPRGAGPRARVSRAGAALTVHAGISTVAGARRVAGYKDG